MASRLSPVGDRDAVGGQNVTRWCSRRASPRGSTATPALLARSATSPVMGVRASVGAPISVAGELWGVMIVASRSEPLPADTEERLAGFTELAATAVANAEAQAEVTASRARIVAAADQARRRIEQDLHDGAQQPLVTLKLQAARGKAAVPPELGELGAELDRAAAVAAGALDELREIARGLHPAVLAKGGLRLGAQRARPPLPGPGGPPGTRRRTAPGAGRGQRLLRRRRGADQRGQARPRLGRRRRGRGRR